MENGAFEFDGNGNSMEKSKDIDKNTKLWYNKPCKSQTSDYQYERPVLPLYWRINCELTLLSAGWRCALPFHENRGAQIFNNPNLFICVCNYLKEVYSVQTVRKPVEID